MSAETVRTELHDLVEGLPDESLPVARRYLQVLRAGGDPLLAMLEVTPTEDEVTSPEEDAGVEEAWQEYRRGETVSADEAKRLLLP